jgi:hypothetical protein
MTLEELGMDLESRLCGQNDEYVSSLADWISSKVGHHECGIVENLGVWAAEDFLLRKKESEKEQGSCSVA